MRFEAVLMVAIVSVTAQAMSLEHSWLSTVNSAPSDSGLGIFDGTNTTIEKHPYLVAIWLEGNFRCAGTIINNNWVMSLAACFFGYKPSDITVVAVSTDGKTGSTFGVKTLFFHPKFSVSEDYNYVCIQLNSTLKWSKKIKPVKLPKKAPKVNTNMVVAGWGKDVWDASDASDLVLRQGMMKWVSVSVCKAIYQIEWTSRMACVYNKGKTTLCVDDFGDPFVYKGVFYGQFAAGTMNNPCSAESDPLLLANIVPVTGWIKKVTSKKEQDY
ncbi:trypsin-7-like [Homalodisca vitripennis]|uniref:trypsin-7-like n=1 Tax=Homalodisca vitripennis TaxID=197043 RepID=UPI001EEAA5C4|nr:trypsin-7-like [Homalodisca vitripennis]